MSLATAEGEPGLRAASSFAELVDWLGVSD